MVSRRFNGATAWRTCRDDTSPWPRRRQDRHVRRQRAVRFRLGVLRLLRALRSVDADVDAADGQHLSKHARKQLGARAIRRSFSYWRRIYRAREPWWFGIARDADVRPGWTILSLCSPRLFRLRSSTRSMERCPTADFCSSPPFEQSTTPFMRSTSTRWCFHHSPTSQGKLELPTVPRICPTGVCICSAVGSTESSPT